MIEYNVDYPMLWLKASKLLNAIIKRNGND